MYRIGVPYKKLHPVLLIFHFPGHFTIVKMESINACGYYFTCSVTEENREAMKSLTLLTKFSCIFTFQKHYLSHLTNSVLTVTEPMLFILLVLRIILKFAGKEGLSEAHILRMFQEKPLKILI